MKLTTNKMGLPMEYHRDGDSLRLVVHCPDCGRGTAVHCTSQEYYNWTVKGMAVQDAFPHMTADDREILLTGICTVCFPKPI